MNEIKNKKHFDLEGRTLTFSKEVIAFISVLPKTLANVEIMKQLVRSAGSVGANYIEANECLSKKDFSMRIKICRKEAKESRYWLELLQTKTEETINKKESLIQEAIELTKIFGAIVEKTKTST